MCQSVCLKNAAWWELPLITSGKACFAMHLWFTPQEPLQGIAHEAASLRELCGEQHRYNLRLNLTGWLPRDIESCFSSGVEL